MGCTRPGRLKEFPRGPMVWWWFFVFECLGTGDKWEKILNIKAVKSSNIGCSQLPSELSATQLWKFDRNNMGDLKGRPCEEDPKGSWLSIHMLWLAGGFLHIFKYVILLYIMHYCLLHMIHMHANLNIYIYMYIYIYTYSHSWDQLGIYISAFHSNLEKFETRPVFL